MAKTKPATPEPAPEPPTGDRSGPPFVVNGRNPASDGNLSAAERLDWLAKQQAVMRRGG